MSQLFLDSTTCERATCSLAAAGLGRLMPARVMADGGVPLLTITESGERPAVVAGRLDPAGEAGPPVIGDWVGLDTSQDTAVIRIVLDRRSVLERRRPGGGERVQRIAANVDRVLIVESFERGPNMRRLERGVALAFNGGATPVIVLSKADLVADPLVVAATVSSAFPGVQVVVCSIVEARGLSELTAILGPGITGALLGPSGVGKSSLVNHLDGSGQRATGEVRAADGRGRHTTTRRQMFGLASGGWLIDTPGIRELGLWLEAEAVDSAFPEIETLAAGCRFRDCRHETEPGCVVRAAVEDGTLDRGRWEGYLRLRAEAEAHERRISPHEQREHERRFAKMVRAVSEQKRSRHR